MLLSVQDVAKRLNCTVSALTRWRREGRGPTINQSAVSTQALADITNNICGGEQND